jgi:hypothetical protein
VTVAAFVLGIIGTVLAAPSLTWQIVAFSLPGARPKLTPVVGVLSAGGLVSGPAARDVTDSQRRAIEQFARDWRKGGQRRACPVSCRRLGGA